MVIQYKQQCVRCKKNWVSVTWKNKFPICFDCQKSDLNGKITSPKMKKLFNIPDEFYRKNAFLRNIKINYLKYKMLTQKQEDAFKNVVEKLREEKV